MTFLPLIGAAALLLAPTATLAQAPTTASVAVDHADLDLSSRRGLATLDHRIARAAREACGYASPTDLAGRNRLLVCREEARTSVTTQRDRLAATARSVEVATAR